MNSNNNTKSEYVSLREAAKFCPYSQDYLKLRARQGKLKATKIGRNWATKKEWVDEYLKQVNNYKKRMADRKVKKAQEVKKVEKKKTLLTEPIPTPTFTSTTSFHLGRRTRVIAVVCALIFIFSSIGLLFGYPYYGPILKSVGNFVKNGTQNFVITIGEFSSNIGESIGQNAADISDNFSENFYNNLARSHQFVRDSSEAFLAGFRVFSDMKNKFAFYIHQDVQSLKKISKKVSENIYRGVVKLQKIMASMKMFWKRIEAFADNLKYIIIEKTPQKIVETFKPKKRKEFPAKIPQQKLLPKSKKKGLITIPSTGRDEETIQKIKTSFSDEVRVIPKDENYGIIIPIFREKEGQKYIYLMVPLKE
ncbi:hypothetical protein J7K42_01165 [bacterium]|nr:hypothetical protein [bacterium]